MDLRHPQLQSSFAGDFNRLISSSNPVSSAPAVSQHSSELQEVHGTTIIALKFDGGVLNLGDRRATAANAIMYDKAEKVLAVDDSTLIALSGSYGRAIEIVRYLKHAFKYYSRTQLQQMSLDGKLQEVSRALQGNLQFALQGIGVFLPIFSAYDFDQKQGRIFFFDGFGARFEAEDFGAAGSGSERIRGIFDYLVKVKGAFVQRPLSEVLRDGLILLDIAADLDSATGGYSKILPSAKIVTAEGVSDISQNELQKAIKEVQGGKIGV